MRRHRSSARIKSSASFSVRKESFPRTKPFARVLPLRIVTICREPLLFQSSHELALELRGDLILSQSDAQRSSAWYKNGLGGFVFEIGRVAVLSVECVSRGLLRMFGVRVQFLTDSRNCFKSFGRTRRENSLGEFADPRRWPRCPSAAASPASPAKTAVRSQTLPSLSSPKGMFGVRVQFLTDSRNCFKSFGRTRRENFARRIC